MPPLLALLAALACPLAAVHGLSYFHAVRQASNVTTDRTFLGAILLPNYVEPPTAKLPTDTEYLSSREGDAFELMWAPGPRILQPDLIPTHLPIKSPVPPHFADFSATRVVVGLTAFDYAEPRNFINATYHEWTSWDDDEELDFFPGHSSPSVHILETTYLDDAGGDSAMYLVLPSTCFERHHNGTADINAIKYLCDNKSGVTVQEYADIDCNDAVGDPSPVFRDELQDRPATVHCSYDKTSRRLSMSSSASRTTPAIGIAALAALILAVSALLL